ncbi:hypothetical protein ACTA71_012644 [Dictyostelium dimigraforme]
MVLSQNLHVYQRVINNFELLILFKISGIYFDFEYLNFQILRYSGLFIVVLMFFQRISNKFKLQLVYPTISDVVAIFVYCPFIITPPLLESLKPLLNGPSCDGNQIAPPLFETNQYND